MYPVPGIPVPGRIRRSGLTLLETLLVIAIVGLLVSLMLPALAGARRAARAGACQVGMRSISLAQSGYAADHKGLLAGFAFWEPGRADHGFADLNYAPDATTAHAYHAVDIVRRLRGTDAVPRFADRIVSRNFSHLILMDAGYLGGAGPGPATICPEDRAAQVLQRYAGDALQGLRLTGDPDPGSSVGYKQLMPYASSYQTVPAAWAADEGPGVMTQARSTVAGSHLLYLVTPERTAYRTTRIDQVAFPGQKVFQFDLFDRHSYKRPIFYAYPSSRQPLAFFDGAVSARRTGDANRGWDPRRPRQVSPTPDYFYAPGPAEPPNLSGLGAGRAPDRVYPYYRWTRRGLSGIDYGGEEVR